MSVPCGLQVLNKSSTETELSLEGVEEKEEEDEEDEECCCSSMLVGNVGGQSPASLNP